MENIQKVNYVAETVTGGLGGMVFGFAGYVPYQKSQAEAMFEKGDGVLSKWIQSKKTFIRLCGGAMVGMSFGTYWVFNRFLAEKRGVEKVYTNWMIPACAAGGTLGLIYPGSPLRRVDAAIMGTGFCLGYGFPNYPS